MLPIVSSAANTPCIQQVAHIVVSSSSIPWPVRRIAPCRRASVRSLSRSTTWRLCAPSGTKNESEPPVRAAPRARAPDSARRSRPRRAAGRRPARASCSRLRTGAQGAAGAAAKSRERPAGPRRSARGRRRWTPRDGPARRGRRTSSVASPPGARRDGARLDHRAGDLMLQPLARQIEPGVDPAAVPVGRPERAASRRWRRRRRRRGSRARPTGARRPARGSAGSSPPARSAGGVAT